MKKLKLYLDTTIWNFSFADDAPQYKSATLEFFKQVKWGRFEVFASEAVQAEIEPAPMERKAKMLALWSEISPTMLENSREVESLSKLYLKKRALPSGSAADALHVAFATVHGMDVLLTWNMDHLAHVGRRNRLIGLNLEEGYGSGLQITTPLEVIGNE
jgi:predicted nucleic acid-binding protein